MFVSATEPAKKNIKPLQTSQKQEQNNNIGDTIHALVFSNASDYFIYKGVPIGFQFDMLTALGKALGKEIAIVVENDPETAHQAIFSNQYDIVAMDYAKHPLIDFYLSYSTPHSTTYAVLIEKKSKQEESTVKMIHVPSQFPMEFTTDSLPEPDKWNIIHNQNVTAEELFEKLGKGEIDYLVCDYNEAITLLPFYTGLVISTRLGEDYSRQWTLKSGNYLLNEMIDTWIAEFILSPKYKKICNTYFSKNSSVIYNSFKKTALNKISPYDQAVKRSAEQFDLDWKFVVSIMYQESRFKTGLTGIGGSFGLMQLMPGTGERFGVDENSSPEQQIHAGVRYIAFLNKQFSDIKDEKERLYFIAAAYNSGPGHINDAQRLCEKYHLNPSVWNDVAKCLKLKSKREYVKDPVVKHGYYPGTHTVKYTDEVMARYHIYSISIAG